MSPPPRDQFTATVLSNISLCREHFRLVLGLPTFPATEPGQFIQIECRPPDDGPSAGADRGPTQRTASRVSESVGDQELDWTVGAPVTLHNPELLHPLALLRRPFSLAGRRDTPGGVELDIIHRVVGVGTDWLAGLRTGDAVGILGPLGNRFALPAPETTALLVGGGVGIPPMIYLAERLAGRKAVVFSGALTRDLLPLTIRSDASTDARPELSIGEFARHGIPAVITTDDGSFGFRGFVTQALETYLDGAGVEGRGQTADGSGTMAGVEGRGQTADGNGTTAGDRAHLANGEGRTAARTVSPSALPSALRPPPSPSAFTIYTCGPEPMMKRVQEIAAERGIACQIAVERAMACGMGTCQSCCIRVRKPDPAQPPLAGRDWCYRLACTDGPVFRGADLLW